MDSNSRRFLLLSVTGLVAACGGSGGQGPVTASNCGVVSGVCTTPVPPEPAPGTGSESAPAALFEVNTLTTFKGVGGTQQLTEVYTKIENTNPVQHTQSELYTAEQSKADTQQVEVSYNPRDAVFTFTIEHEESDAELRFQDPAHRTDFNPNRQPQTAVPNLPLFNYLESGSASADSRDIRTFFYQRPGNGTRYVSLTGFTRNIRDGKLTEDFKIQRVRGAYAFGSQSAAADVPTRGSGTYRGAMLATMVRNTELEQSPGVRSRFEWIHGQAQVDVDFAAGSLKTTFDGVVQTAGEEFEGDPFGTYNNPLPAATFRATGTATFDTSRVTYAGSISQATIGPDAVSIAASSLDGTFYGPTAIETGGAFRIVGSIPDQRVDIIGGFAGARPSQ